MERSQKEIEVKQLTEHLGRAQAAFVADYKGMTALQMSALRKALRATGAHSKVYKNRLVNISLDQAYSDCDKAQIAKLKELLSGTNLFVLSFDDVVGAAKAVSKFAGEKDSKFKLKGAWFENSFLEPKGIEQLSKMPSKNELIGKLLGLLNAPATQLLRVIQAPGAQTARVIEAQRAKLEQK